MMKKTFSILVIDDDEHDSKLIAELLKDATIPVDYQLRSCNGRESDLIERMSDPTIDCIILDHHLGHISGASILKQYAETSNINPVIMFSGDDSPGLATQFLSQGAREHLSKNNFDSMLIHRTIQYAIKYHNYDRERTSFLAHMSHEIRTPLNGIIGILKILSRSDLAPALQGMVGTANRASNSLLHLLDEILDFSKATSGHITLRNEPYVVADIISDVAKLHQPLCEEKGIHLTVVTSPDLPQLILGDRHRFRQVITNILSNAIKFTSEGGVTITTTAADDRLSVAVADTGVGIAANHLNSIFSPFVQAKKTIHETYGGTGLGLAICQKIVLLMGGHISVESEEQVGSTFLISIPIQALREQSESP